MGRLKKIIDKIQDKNVENNDELKEFTVKVTECDINKWFITTYKSKNKTECLKELHQDYKGKDCDFRFL